MLAYRRHYRMLIARYRPPCHHQVIHNTMIFRTIRKIQHRPKHHINHMKHVWLGCVWHMHSAMPSHIVAAVWPIYQLEPACVLLTCKGDFIYVSIDNIFIIFTPQPSVWVCVCEVVKMFQHMHVSFHFDLFANLFLAFINFSYTKPNIHKNDKNKSQTKQKNTEKIKMKSRKFSHQNVCNSFSLCVPMKWCSFWTCGKFDHIGIDATGSPMELISFNTWWMPPK